MSVSSVLAERQISELGGVPIDRVAWRVLSKGEHWEPKIKSKELIFDAPPPPQYKPHKRYEHKPTNLLGKKVGRMTVVAYWGARQGQQAGKGGNQNQRWVCRCPCGLFVIRTARVIIRAKDPDDKCLHCRYLGWIQKRNNPKPRDDQTLTAPADCSAFPKEGL